MHSSIYHIRPSLNVHLAREPLLKGRHSTVDLLTHTSLDQLLLVAQTLFTIYKASYLNKEVNCTEPSPLISVPSLRLLLR